MTSILGGADAPPECEGAAPAKSDPNEISKTKRSQDSSLPVDRIQEHIVRLPASDCDLLTGIKQMAAWFGLTVGQVRAKIEAGEIIVFYLPGKSTVYALKSSQHRRWHQAEEAYLNRGSALPPVTAPANGAEKRGQHEH